MRNPRHGGKGHASKRGNKPGPLIQPSSRNGGRNPRTQRRPSPWARRISSSSIQIATAISMASLISPSSSRVMICPSFPSSTRLAAESTISSANPRTARRWVIVEVIFQTGSTFVEMADSSSPWVPLGPMALFTRPMNTVPLSPRRSRRKQSLSCRSFWSTSFERSGQRNPRRKHRMLDRDLLQRCGKRHMQGRPWTDVRRKLKAPSGGNAIKL